MGENSNSIVGKNALAVMQNQEIFKRPSGAPKKKKKQEVLEEDVYVEEIGKIIQRDFFPDLEKLKAQNDYFDAMEKNDTVRLRQLYAKYSGSRPPTERIPSPATFETPANIHNSQSTPTSTPFNIEDNTENSVHISSEPKVSLDQFLNSHTSQDNESFEEILHESEKKHKLKYHYLYKDESACSAEEAMKLALPTIEEQCALPEKQLNVDTWAFKNKNYIMFVPDGVSLTEEQQIELNKKRQEVVYSNTRLKLNPFNEMQNQETINELAKTQAKGLDGKIGVDGKELIKTGQSLGGYSLLPSPSPSPGVMGSPFMTWGTIEGTPFRLDGSDTPLPKSQGPAFKMSEPPRREQIALALTEKVGEKNRDQKKKAIDAQKRQFATPSPRTARSSIDRLASMSPAAKKLATSKLKLGVNSELLVSYSPSPSHRAKTPITPRRISTPKARKPIELSTDDLLKINLPKRQKASDFF